VTTEQVQTKRRLWSTAEVAEAIGYHEESVRRCIREGRVRAVRCGPRYRVPDDEFAKICAEGIPLLEGGRL
jgi:excisionase family DNA binding protein